MSTRTNKPHSGADAGADAARGQRVVIDLTGIKEAEEASAGPVAALPTLHPETLAASLHTWLGRQRNELPYDVLQMRLHPDGPDAALAAVSDHRAGLKMTFLRRVRALPPPSAGNAETYATMTQEQRQALPRWEQLVASSCRRWSKLGCELDDVCSELKEAMEGSTLQGRVWAAVQDIGYWLDRQNRKHAKLLLRPGPHDFALRTFEAGFAQLTQCLHLRAGKAEIDADNYPRVIRYFEELRATLRGAASLGTGSSECTRLAALGRVRHAATSRDGFSRLSWSSNANPRDAL
jgi:hypothetical protein